MVKIVIPMVLILSLLAVGCSNMATMYEYNNPTYADNGYAPGYYSGALITAQTFTPSVNHTVTHLRLGVQRVHTPASGIHMQTEVAIKATAAGLPTGADLCSGTFHETDINYYAGTDDLPWLASWVTVSLGAGTALTAGTMYAIVLSSAECDEDFEYSIFWNGNSGVAAAYAGGTMCRYNVVTGWVIEATDDCHFEEWNGLPDHTVPLATTSSVRVARPLLVAGGDFTVPLCEVICAGLQPYHDLSFTVPICAVTCTPLQGLHAHNLNHPIIRPEYFDEPKLVNRVYVVGVDADGNTVYGEDKDSSINGEVLQIYPDSMITTTDDANTIAAYILDKARINAPRGQITIPPAIQMELWDVIKIDDSICNQSSALYRVAGWQFNYSVFIPNRQEADYKMTVNLTAV